jgi:hypothetical protein
MNRKAQLEQWLQQLEKFPTYQLQPLAGDASFRKYYRLTSGGNSFIVMDAPPELEDCQPFVKIAELLRQHDLSVPVIFAQNFQQGFLLLSDFGDDLYLKKLNENNAENLYLQALNALSRIQTIKEKNIPAFDAEFMLQELKHFEEWFLIKHCKQVLTAQHKKMLSNSFEYLIQSAVEQPQVFIHRDYHSANLMVLANQQVGILDFQDAFTGPITYDLVSLLRDCYISWPQEFVKKIVIQFCKNLQGIDENTFLRWFDLMGIQRHLKAIFIFARKFHRDQNSNYLQHIPRTLKYVISVGSQYNQCEELADFLKGINEWTDTPQKVHF